MVRTPSYDQSSGIRKGTWTKEEDEKLKAYVTKYGCWNWRLIPKFAGNKITSYFNSKNTQKTPLLLKRPICLSRCGKSCRLRWMNYLRSDIKRGNFRKEEDDLILELHKTLGNRWSAIAAHLPGRTDNEIKNHWHTNLKKLSNDEQSSNSEVEATTSSNTPYSRQNTLDEGSDQTLFVLNSETPSTSFSADHFSSMVTQDFAADKSTNLGEADRVVSAEESIELGGNLWTDPLIFEDTYNNNNPSDVPMELFEDYPEFPPLFDEFLWP